MAKHESLTGTALHLPYNQGTSFPGSPATNDKYYRTDRNILYFYNGTRWLSTTLYACNLSIADALLPLAATGTSNRMMAPFSGVYDLWLEQYQFAFFVASGGTALGASHSWTCTLLKQPAGSTVSSVVINSGASNTWRDSGAQTINALLGTTNFDLEVGVGKVGTPGNLYIMPTVTLRLVG